MSELMTAPTLSESARRAWNELHGDPKVDERVKTLLAEEYPEDHVTRRVFVEHTAAVVALATELALKVGADGNFVREAAWLHDLGIKYTRAPGIDCHGEEPYMKHGLIGSELCRQAGLPGHAEVCLRHVGTGLTAEEIRQGGLPLPEQDMLCRTLEEKIVCYADQFFSKSTPHPLSLEEVRRRVNRHGSEPLRRFEEMHRLLGLSRDSSG